MWRLAMRISISSPCSFIVRLVAAFLFLGFACHAFAQPATAPATEPATQPADAASFSLLLTQGVAPCTVHVHAIGIPLAHGTPLTGRYEWDFGDPTGRYNKLPGWNAAHVYDRPGEYLVSLTLTDDAGKRAIFSKKITIAPDDRRTLFVAAEGVDESNNRTDS